MIITQRDRDIWRAAITLANNLCVQESDRERDNDGPCAAIVASSDCAKRIREWVTPTDQQLVEMFSEAGVQQ
jgi:hypothetical protein